jgi:cobaltochelatase CobN
MCRESKRAGTGRVLLRQILGLLALFCCAAGAWANPPPARIAFVYTSTDRTSPDEIRRAIAPLSDAVEITLFASGPGGSGLSSTTQLADFDLIFVDGKSDGLEPLVAQLNRAAEKTKLVVVRTPASVSGNVTLTDHPWLTRYWENPSQKNYLNLVRYLLVHILQRTSPSLSGGAIAEPIIYPTVVFYHPDAPLPGFFPTLSAYLEWYRSRTPAAGVHRYDPAELTLGFYSSLTFLQQDNLAHVDALIRASERRGANIVTFLGRGSPAFSALLGQNGRPVVDALMFGEERLHLNNYQAGLAQARRLGVPLLSVLNHPKLTAAQFEASATGLHPDLTAPLVSSERDGVIEPIVVAAKGSLRNPRGSRYFISPLPEQVEWRVDRALAWAKLQRAPNASKRIVFTYWSEGGGKANVGGDPDDFLDVQASLVRLLGRLKEQGYDTGAAALPERDALANRMALQASNVGTWAPGELASRVKTADVALIPEAVYLAWFDSLPVARRVEIVEMWGPPPGNIMVHTEATGKRFLVIPKIQFGNVLIAPHPDWGYLQDNKALMSAGALPPHHQYLAFFLWLRHEFHADAWVSLFSNIVLQPGKSEGPAVDDQIGLLLGALPHIHPERLGGNGGIGNKRKAMAQTVGWFNLVVPSEATEQLFELRARLARYAGQPDTQLRSQAEPFIRAEIARTGLDRALAPLDPATAPFDELVKKTEAFLADLERAHMPHGSKILGDAPTGSALSDMTNGMLGSDLRSAIAPLTPSPAVAARSLVFAVVNEGVLPNAALLSQLGQTSDAAESQLALATDYAGRLQAAPREIAGILDALSGRYIEPGPMDEPMRNPDSLPPGRSLYNFDQAAIPTVEAEAVGVRQAEALIAAHRETHAGAYPTKMAFVLWSGEIAKNNGITEAQILHLLGTRAVRNARGLVTGVELIPSGELGRPRVDVLVTTSGAYRDHYQDKVELIAQATHLAAASPEMDNPVAVGTRVTAERLIAAGESPERASALSYARVFSPAPGAYSPSIQFLAKSGDQRGDEARMADLFTRRMSHAYGGGLYGLSARPAFEQNLVKVDAATLPRSSNVNALLDHPMSAGFLGGLNLAAKAITGRDIDLYVSNLRNSEDVSIEPAARALQSELRSRYFNPKWLKEMQAHGYDGARNMMFLTNQLDLWNTTAKKMVSSADWSEVKAVYVDDKLGLQMDGFFEKYNPHAQQVLLANLLGAAARGQWQANRAELAQVARRLVESTTKNGSACEASLCRNAALTEQIAEVLGNSPESARLVKDYRAALEQATTLAPAQVLAAPTARANANTNASTNASTAPPSAKPTTTGSPSSPASKVAANSQQPAEKPPIEGFEMKEEKRNPDALTPELTYSALAGLLVMIVFGFGWSAWRRRTE